MQNKIKLLIPDEIKDKIQFLCKKIAKDEWSGVLFYTVKGDIDKASKMEITVKDILLMDRGTSTYTSFDWDEDVVGYMMDNPDAIDWHKGHIHSHNTMRVFFSGTDDSELNDNCTNHNFYLSVIVNNYTDIIGQVAFAAQPTTFTAKNKAGKDYQLTLTQSTLKPLMMLYECEVVMNSTPIVVPDIFAERITAIEEKVATKKAEAEKARQKTLAETANYNKGKYEVDLRNKKDATNGKIHEQPLLENNKDFFMKGIDAEDDDFTMQTLEQDFATHVLRLGNDVEVEDDELEDALVDIENSRLNIKALANSIIDTYGAMHARFFDKYPAYQGDEAFLETLTKVIEALEEHEAQYPFVEVIVSRLKALGNRFEALLKEKV